MEDKKKKKGFFRSLSDSATKAGDTVEQVGKDLKHTADKVQEVLDDSNENVKIVIKIALVALAITAAASIINMGVSVFSHHGHVGKQNQVPTIIVHNLYLKALTNTK